jgi:hypothetical protein
MIQIGGFVHKLYVGKTQEEGKYASLYLKPSATNAASMAAIIKVGIISQRYPLKSIIGNLSIYIFNPPKTRKTN